MFNRYRNRRNRKIRERNKKIEEMNKIIEETKTLKDIYREKKLILFNTRKK